ncbi:drug transporter [Moniliophthora roreri MCA 2997]|uniref:Drug transporter n=1 Tax=Moniliophthora roreri (strain MCA 2997) TaxID=1381753 RepID=V2WS54_MONRO|nr:drug transporter [Moniliophthora roreri MCA 2997]KAI3595864.1 drug transporter [Moniliophthora roreri]
MTGSFDRDNYDAESARTLEGLAVKSLKDVREASLDPRVTITTRPMNELDEGFLDRIAHHGHHETKSTSSDKEKKEKEYSGTSDESEPIYIEFEPGDKRNPMNFPPTKKWTITALACYFTLLSAATAGAYNMGFPTMTPEIGCTEYQATIGLSLYALGFGLVPLVTASFSEEFGRQALYVVSSLGFMLMYLMIAKAKNIQTILVARFLQGGFGSTGSTMVGGTVADIWAPNHRGLPMALFALTAIGGTGFGPVFAGWIEMNSHLGWRWIQWIQMINASVMFVLIPLVMKETRASIILTRLAKRLRKETGDKRYRARVEDERASLKMLVYISCTRPVYLMFTEPVVASFSLWIGFAWGVLYCMLESISSLFRNIHGFNIGQVGTVFCAMIIGSSLGFLTNFIQERYYQKGFASRGPEARLYSACIAAILFPGGMFIYAWTSFSHVSWVGLAMGVLVFTWSAYVIYLAVFSYLADCYGPFASSALAGQSLCRNIAGFTFPLFTNQMFKAMTYKWASTMFALIATVMIPIPFILFFHGPKIRSRSKFSSMVMESKK